MTGTLSVVWDLLVRLSRSLAGRGNGRIASGGIFSLLLIGTR